MIPPPRRGNHPAPGFPPLRGWMKKQNDGASLALWRVRRELQTYLVGLPAKLRSGRDTAPWALLKVARCLQWIAGTLDHDPETCAQLDLCYSPSIGEIGNELAGAALQIIERTPPPPQSSAEIIVRLQQEVALLESALAEAREGVAK